MVGKEEIKVGVISLGCDKNRVDSENMLSYLAEGGFEIVGDMTKADVVVINTCAFTKDAKKEAIDNILDAAAEKAGRAKGNPLGIIVSGCLPERYRESLSGGLPEADAFIGINDYASIGEIVKKIAKNCETAASSTKPSTKEEMKSSFDVTQPMQAGEGQAVFCFSDSAKPTQERILTTPPHYAYLKIADGCANHCTFCAIPKIRGGYRSRTIESLVMETEKLISEYGIKELILVAQDTTRYGIDIYGGPSLKMLLEALSKTAVKWIRVLYLYPELMTDELVEYMKANPKIVKYADVPLQHISDGVLRRMGRRNTGAEAKALVKKLKKAGFAVRSSFIAGFPAETDEEHAELLDFINTAEIDFAGFFAYSKEEDTAAEKMKGQIPAAIKKKRHKALTDVQKAVMARNAAKKVGHATEVLYEGIDYDRQMFYGRTQFQAPDVDSLTFFTADFAPEVGEFYSVKMTGTDGLNLLGEAIAGGNDE